MPQEMVEDILAAIRGQFYFDCKPKQFFQDRNFLLKRVILWPASWLSSRAVTVAPDRYKRILLDIFQDIKRHGKTDQVAFWPGYLAKCVQDHFKHHGEDIYNEAKNVRAILDAELSKLGSIPRPDPIKALADAASILRPLKRHKLDKSSPARSKQLTLL